MSMYCHTQTLFKDRTVLVDALEKMGFTKDQIEIHEEPQNLYGYRGDVRAQKAHIIIRRKHISSASNDIGFVRTENGTFEAIISEYDVRIGYNPEWITNLKKHYSEGIVRKQFKQKGIPIQVQKREDGTIRLVGHVRG